MRANLGGPHSQITRTSPELAAPLQSFLTTPAGGLLTDDVKFNVHQGLIHDGSAVESCFEFGTLHHRSRDHNNNGRPLIAVGQAQPHRDFEFVILQTSRNLTFLGCESSL
ncbi:hypothetical protein AVEN_194874-1 [Araneus ventricosus]|uniref:Uncharacterized protein n=1 Tax=Araneus ventricosus TaxID=182803 RepID=A0A4Y2B6E7_ARAVE|nr:hypothetical protein AVEN_194874-1 [Araneus ventricosus]